MAGAGVTHSSEFPAVERPLSKRQNVDNDHRMPVKCQWRLFYYPGGVRTGSRSVGTPNVSRPQTLPQARDRGKQLVAL